MKRLSLSLVFLFSFGVFLFLSCPSVSSFRDAGDLASAALTLGVAHPPGYPSYVLAGRAATAFLRAGNAALRLNAFSALCAAAAVLFCSLILFRFGGIAGALLGLPLALLSAPLLSQSGTSEIYVLNAALNLGFLWGAFFVSDLPLVPRRRGWVAVFFLWSLGLGNHQTLLLTLPVFLLFFFRERRSGLFCLPFLGHLMGAVLAGLSINLFLPVRGGRALYLWGEPRTWSGLVGLLTRSDYGAGVLSTRYSNAAVPEALAFWFREWGLKWGGLGTGLCAATLVYILLKKEAFKWAGPFLVLWVFTGPVFAMLSRLSASELSSAILLPSLIVPALAAAVSVGLFLRWVFGKGIGGALAALGLWIFVLVFGAVPRALSQNHRWDLQAHDYGQNLFRTYPPGAVVLMISDAALFSAHYRQAALRQRADLIVLVNSDLSWRWRQYRKRYPELFAAGQPDGGAALVKAQAGRRDFYTDGMQAQLLEALCPLGVGARVVWPARTGKDVETMAQRDWLWSLYARRPPAAKTLAGDYYSRTIIQTISSNAYNAGLLLAQAGRDEDARRCYAQSLFWSPARMLRWEESF